MNKSEIIIVNNNDEVISSKERESLSKGEIYRVSALWIKNSKGEILLAQRKFTKKHDPGKWGPAVAGTNEKGESYEANIIKEAEEEIGIKNYPFKKAKKVRYSGEYNYFCQWFTITIDKDIKEFKIQEEEIEQLKWYKKDELLKDLNINPDKYLNSVKNCISWFN